MAGTLISLTYLASFHTAGSHNKFLSTEISCWVEWGHQPKCHVMYTVYDWFSAVFFCLAEKNVHHFLLSSFMTLGPSPQKHPAMFPVFNCIDGYLVLGKLKRGQTVVCHVLVWPHWLEWGDKDDHHGKMSVLFKLNIELDLGKGFLPCGFLSEISRLSSGELF